ncbi:hypothetical protein GCM10009779_00170 [Polymorphospora rubra]|uniref:Uncharacterized protein n=2 Tax=Polymorphospora rubra TaxID=338584 RepID=A0A810N8A8_9ACTN|nr:hypothetical protein Prubr_57150 [Polymorphospora rubra]
MSDYETSQTSTDYYETPPKDESSFSFDAGFYNRETTSVVDDTATERDAYGGEVKVDYPDSWLPEGSTGPSEFGMEAEVYREEVRTIENGVSTDTTGYGGNVSVDY